MKRPWLITILYILLLDIVVLINLLDVDHWYVKLFFYAALSCGIAIHIFIADKQERKDPFSNKAHNQDRPYLERRHLPLFIAVCVVFFLPILGLIANIFYLFSHFLLIFLHISIYNAVLLLLLPFLRKHFSSRVCAALWSLPSILYITFIPLVQKGQPLLVIPVDLTIGKWVTLIWIAGFAATLLYYIISHLLYRRKILKNAKQDWDMDFQRIWYDTLGNGRFKGRYYPVMRSNEVDTPLSIGFFRKTACVVLPQKTYTSEELKLILRHEAIHIARRDSFTKLFITFTACVCWFNPLAWIVLRHCCADMELSCDETVLFGESSEVKERYADLLLKTAGDDSGFSTCLSASAKTMLYRLTHALNPQKRSLGAFVAGIAMFLLMGTFGQVAVAYNPTPGSDLLDTVNSKYWTNDIIYKVNDERTDYAYDDISLLRDYVSDITFYRLSGTYAYPHDDTSIIFSSYKTADGSYYKTSGGIITNGAIEWILRDHTLTIIDYTDLKTDIYYHNADIDWDHLLSLAKPVS